MRFIAVLNRDGGTLRTMDLAIFCAEATTLFAAHGHQLDCRVVKGKQVAAALRTAVATPGIDAIVAGGGDGTISAAAGIAFAAGVPLGVLPAGTMNLFARALDMPLTLPEALAAIAGGEIDLVDIATANDRPFVHQFGVGVHARLVRIRDGMTYGSRIGKMLASLRAIAATAVNPPRFTAEIRSENGVESREVAGIAVSNNPLGSSIVPFAERLDGAVLGVYVAAPLSSLELLKLAWALFRGTWRASPVVSEAEVAEVILRFPHRKRGVKAVIDGELIALEQSVRLKLHPRALKVVRPRAENGPRPE